MTEALHARIAVLAFHLYEQRGHQDGHEVEDWVQAEQRTAQLLINKHPLQ